MPDHTQLPGDDTPNASDEPTATASGREPAPVARTKWILAALAALAVALFAVPFLRGPESTATPAGQTASIPEDTRCASPEGTANLDFTMKDLRGADVRLSDYKGKVILLNFWATWCGPCKLEIPEFVDVYHEYKDRGFEILGVLAMDEPSAEDLQAFTSEFKMSYPVFRANEEFENAHGPLFALPTSFIIDRTGTICTKHLGPLSREMLEQEIAGLL